MPRPSWTCSRVAGVARRAAVPLVVLALLLSAVAAVAAPAGKAAQAEGLAKQAAALAKQGKLGLAAQMFHAAFELNPQACGYLYSAARAEHLAGDKVTARRDYARYLKAAPADHALRKRAMTYAREVAEPAPPPAPQPAPTAARRRTPSGGAQPAAVRPAAASQQGPFAVQSGGKAAATVVERSGWLATHRRTIGWIAAGAGVLGAAAGGWIYLDARGRAGDLKQQTALDDNGQVVGISHEEARDQATAIESELRAGGVVLGVGVAIAAAGGWLVWSSPAPPEVSLDVRPGQGGRLSVGWRF